MEIIQDKVALTEKLALYRALNPTKVVGFVPTMGGLHAGHISLIKRSKSECALTVVSIFLNPTQFNNANDLRTYPHDDAQDIALLQGIDVDILFMPSVSEMYEPNEEAPNLPLGKVSEVMEGAFRPGHFQGVVWIVGKLFRLVRPDKAYFGLKDFQQIAVIQRMLELSPDLSLEIVPCPVIREKDGLAMSSRNNRLSPEERAVAPLIYRSLVAGQVARKEGKSLAEVHRLVVESIHKEPLLRVEYFSIVDANTLEELTSWNEHLKIVGAITVYCGEVRLIDHIEF